MNDPRRTGGGDPETALAGLLELARAKLPTPTPPADAGQDPSYLAVRRRLDGERPGATRGRAPLWLTLPALGALLLAGGLVYRALEPDELDYVVQGGAEIEGGYLRARADAEAQLSFSDGSQVELERRSGGRVAAVGPRGARVQLDDGRARVRVVPRPRRDGDWVFDAGPCRVHVTGTRFDMRWSRDEQVLEVRLYTGAVTVKGPPAPEGVVMQPGQHLLMNVRRDFIRLSTIAPAAAAPVHDVDTPEELPTGSGPATVAPPARPAPEASGPSEPGWSAQVLAGDFAGVLREARRRGLGQVLARRGAADVMALAEAARLSRQDALARRALRTLVARFPRSAQADKALFLLGRLAEDVDGEPETALGFYRSYLQAAPDGPYRDEVLGRQMTATLRAAGPAQARPLAEAYLRRYPDGAYAEPARAILGRSP